MDESRSEILTGIQELRAKAAKQLTGNEYYMVAQQLDTLASSPELGGDLAQSFLDLIQSRLNAESLFRDLNGLTAGIEADVKPSDRMVSAGAGDPEIPSPAETPAEPSSPPPEEPSIPDSPAEPAPSPGPDIPSPPGSPGGPSAPPEIQHGEAANPDGRLITPKANSFGTPQATGAISLTSVTTDGEIAPNVPTDMTSGGFPPISSGNGVAPAQGGLMTAAEAARVLVNQNLTGNAYYQAANLIMAIRNLPQSASAGEAISKPNDFNEALALLREQAGTLSGAAREEAASLAASLQAVVMPQSESATGLASADDTRSNAASAAVTESTQTSEPAEIPTQAKINLSDAPDPEPDPGPRTGFDNLAETSWHRVKDVDRAERNPEPSLNGSSAPQAVAAAATPADRPIPISSEATPEIAEPLEPDFSTSATTLSQDNGKAFNDGGSESLSSEPSEAGRFESAGTDFAISGDDQPSSEPQSSHQAEAVSETAISAEAEVVTNPPPIEADPVGTATSQGAETSTLLQEAQAVIESTAEELVSKTDDAIAAVLPMREAENPAEAANPPDEIQPEFDPASQSHESVAEETTEIRQADQPAEAEHTASDSASEEAIPAATAENKQMQEPAKGGFFSRLFGLRSSENR